MVLFLLRAAAVDVVAVGDDAVDVVDVAVVACCC